MTQQTNKARKSASQVGWLRTGSLVGVLLCAGAGQVSAQALSQLVATGLSPAFSPTMTQYTVPKPANCVVNVTATLANPAHRLYIANAETASGVTRAAWACSSSGKIDVVIYQNWTEVGRYTITPNAPPPAPPPPPPGYGKLSALVIAGLSPMFDPETKTYSIPRTTACSVPVTATLAYSGNTLHVQNGATASGTTRNAWVCDGRTKIDIVIYQVWTEVGRYTVNVVDGMGAPPPGMNPPPPPPSTPPPPQAAEPPPQASPAPVITTPLPQPAPVDLETAVTFLQQATLGPNAADVAAVMANGREYWLVQQMKLPETTIPDGLDINALRAQVYTNMTNGNDQLRQRITFALAQLLVISANKNTNGYEVLPFMRLLSRHAFGNYRTLLREVTLSPSMGKYLDLANSRKSMNGSAPNENFTRELLQLFTVGLVELNRDGSVKMVNGAPAPTFNTTSLREIARALTGWTYPTQPGGTLNTSNNEYFVGLMEPRPQYHDTNSKTFFGHTLPASQTVTKDLEDTLDIVFNHPNVPPFVATRLIRALTTSNPSAGYIDRVAAVFENNGSNVRGDLAAVITAVLTDAEAAVTGPEDGRVRDAVSHVIALGRALNAQVTDPGMFMYLFGTLGQMPLTPATVFSFYSPLAGLPGRPDLYGPEFQIYTPAQVIQRANFIYNILNGQMGSAFSVSLAPFTAVAGVPANLVNTINQTLFFGRMSPGLQQVLVSLTQATSDPTQRAVGALYIAAISSEFAVHTGGQVQ